MIKKVFLVYLLISILIIPMTVFSGENIKLENPSFEVGQKDIIKSWTKSIWDNKNGVSQIYIDNKVFNTGKNSVVIINNYPNDARIIQEIKVKSDSFYKISCLVKTEGIGETGKGANVSGVGITETSLDIKGTSVGWKLIELYGRTGKSQNTFVLSLGVGSYSNTNTGKAWFDDITIKEINSLPSKASYINLFNDENVNISSNSILQSSIKKVIYFLPYTFFLLACFFLIYTIINYINKSSNRKSISTKEIVRKIKESPRNRIISKKINKYIYIIFCSGIIIRLIFALTTEGHPTDMNCFRAWSNWASNNFTNFYNTKAFVDYPPLYIYILFITGKIINILNYGNDIIGQNFIVKLPSIFADIITAYMLFKLACKYHDKKWGIIISSIYIFNPVVLLNSSIWGQVDSFFTMLIVFAIILVNKKKYTLASIVYILAVLMKPQGIIFLPVLLFEILKNKKLKELLLSIIFALFIFVLVILPFSFNQEPLWIFKLYIKTISEYPYASVNAFNLFYFLGGNWKNSGGNIEILGMQTFLSYKFMGYTFIVLITSFSAFLYYKFKNNELAIISSLLLIVGVFVLSSGMHERYMFPATALSLLAFIYIKDIRFLFIHLGISITGFINTVYIYEDALKKINSIQQYDYLFKLTSIINIIILIYLIKVIFNLVISKKNI